MFPVFVFLPFLVPLGKGVKHLVTADFKCFGNSKTELLSIVN